MPDSVSFPPHDKETTIKSIYGLAEGFFRQARKMARSRSIATSISRRLGFDERSEEKALAVAYAKLDICRSMTEKGPARAKGTYSVFP